MADDKTGSNDPARLLHPIPEARRVLGGISNTSFYELAGRGEIKFVKIGRRSFVTDDELRRFVATLSASK